MYACVRAIANEKIALLSDVPGEMTKRRKLRIIVMLALLLVFILTGVTGGCDAHRRPPNLNAHERQLLRAPPLPYTVTVKPWDPETAAHMSQNAFAYAQRVASTLMPSGAFRTTRFENNAQASGGDLIATSTGIYCNRAIIPLWTLLTLGIIPTVFEDENCEDMELRRAGAPASATSVQIEFRYTGRVVPGWGAVIMGILPGWSYGSARSDPRFYQRFRLEVIRHQREIEDLMHQ
jgi:hypothetical protein